MTEMKTRFHLSGKAYLLFYVIIGLLCAALLFCRFYLHPATIVGDSMYPTFTDGEIVKTSVYDPNEDILQSGDVIIFDSENYGKKLIKRVEGVGGDVIQIKDGILYRNGEVIEEGYPMMEDAGIAAAEFTVPEGSVFCLGDNRNNSSDSRKIGCIPLDDVNFVVEGVLLAK